LGGHAQMCAYANPSLPQYSRYDMTASWYTGVRYLRKPKPCHKREMKLFVQTMASYEQ
jgi:hypothetical protein